MNILISLALLLLLAAGPARATEPDAGFGDSYFTNTQPPGFSDPVSAEAGATDAAGAASIEPAAGDEATDQSEATTEAPRKMTQHEVAPVGPATAIGTEEDDSE